MAGEMRANPDEPRRALCPRCRHVVLVVTVAGRRGAVDPELHLEREELPPAGLYVALAGDGSTRPLRIPTRVKLNGLSLHVPHELSCDG